LDTERTDLAIGSSLPDTSFLAGDPRVDALGRVTSSLTTHVLSAAREQSRDAAEHVLDISRAHYSEGGEQQIKIRCDVCGVLSPGAGSQARAEVSARALGWDVTDDVDQCPTCRPDAPKLLEGQVTSSIPKALLSSPELILISRLQYFAGRVKDGTSPRAAIINSRSSGHRHMLTDFASGFGYDFRNLHAALEDLETRGVKLPTNPTSNEAALDWYGLLFGLLKIDDDVP
jgi:hypothetical protein